MYFVKDDDDSDSDDYDGVHYTIWEKIPYLITQLVQEPNLQV